MGYLQTFSGKQHLGTGRHNLAKQTLSGLQQSGSGRQRRSGGTVNFASCSTTGTIAEEGAEKPVAGKGWTAEAQEAITKIKSPAVATVRDRGNVMLSFLL
jgi:hypothetical protein